MTITLPRLCGARESARTLVSAIGNEKTPFVNATETKSTAQGFVDELCSAMVDLRIDKVTILNASENFQTYFMRSHMLRRAKFLVEYVEQ